ncbi:MAG TPA: hypothetical protein VJO16_15095 [Candidatus Acidoferrum sp.]|nr:hypothetical protein [Candidatus Acidoferrum sp.]
MAPDERDRMLDKALARHLRSSVSAGETPSVVGPQSSECPDPEALAAYHERSLLPEQMNSLKEHIVGCANCQTVLAHLEMTDDIPLQAAEEEQILAESMEATAAVVPSSAPASSPEARARKSRRLRLLSGARWQWLAPAGAIAAGLLVWISLHENRPLPLPSPGENESKMAKNQAPPLPIPSGVTREPQSSPPANPSPTLARPQSSADGYAVSNGRAASGAAKQSQVLGGAAGARSADALTDEELHERKDRQRDEVADQLTAANRTDLDTKTAAESLRKKEDASSQALKIQAETVEVQNAQIQNQNNSNLSQKIPGPAPMGQMQAPAKKKSARAAASAAPSAAPPPPPAEVNGAVSSYADTGSLIVARSISSSRLFSSPGSNSIWRVGRRGLIEFSKDAGNSWSSQSSGVLVDLVTGSAPSDQVCWIVGKAGAVLLTIDGGAHWRVLPSPPTEDLEGVLAFDALHATIWNARKTKSFATSDGGLTWKPAPNP